MDTVRILIADDHSLMREGTQRILEQYPDLKVVGQAGDGETALELARSLQPDLAILDVRMPKMNGIEVVRRLKDISPDTRTLMLTAYDDDEYILALMEAGASGYILKTTHAADLVEAVRRVHQGETALDPAIAMKVARLWSLQRNQKHDLAEQLSQRELEVLELAAKGFRNKDIAETLSLSIRTVEGHFNGIFAKLQVSSRVEAVLYALSHHVVALQEKEKA